MSAHLHKAYKELVHRSFKTNIGLAKPGDEQEAVDTLSFRTKIKLHNEVVDERKKT